MKSPLLHEAAAVLLQGKGEGAKNLGHVHTLEMHDGVLQPCGQTGHVTSRGGSARAETMQVFCHGLKGRYFPP